MTQEHPADALREWLSTYISTMHDEDLDVLTLWILHTHFIRELFTTGRLLLDSPVPESGKTTVLEHMSYLALDPVQASSISSGSLIPRLLDQRPRTILIDEADRALSPDNPNNKEIIATVNSGYKRGGSRPVLIPTEGGGWDAKEMSTFGAVAMAGNNPELADDTRSRTIRVLLMPDTLGVVEESDWEFLEAPAGDLKARIEQWAETNADEIRSARPALPEGVKGRLRECWSPLLRVASLCGDEWLHRAEHLATRALELRRAEVDAGLRSDPPKVLMLKAMLENWPEGQERWKTAEIIQMLAAHNPTLWEEDLIKGRKRVTAQAIGRTLSGAYGLRTRQETTGDRERAYYRSDFDPVFLRMGLLTPSGLRSDRSNLSERSAETNRMHGENASNQVTEGVLLTLNDPTCDGCGEVLQSAYVQMGRTTHPGCAPKPATDGTQSADEPMSKRDQLLDFVRTHGVTQAADVVEALPGWNVKTAVTVLGQLVDRGDLYRPARGQYDLAERRDAA